MFGGYTAGESNRSFAVTRFNNQSRSTLIIPSQLLWRPKRPSELWFSLVCDRRYIVSKLSCSLSCLLFLQRSVIVKQGALCNKEEMKHKHAGRQHSLSTWPTSAHKRNAPCSDTVSVKTQTQPNAGAFTVQHLSLLPPWRDSRCNKHNWIQRRFF